ncbi:hypothetical protein [Streptomyces sp. H27-H5]|uniref:hypothetical protein n=1 Tax=Streptomyces sp. H27-H5 TaxID=2996460 RepID=UPI00226DBF3F|nr:hypothetical protein [Streptomyces sp. H27-H5]MCY0955818.1 hypothetical protein [Streptomyces sp. H27-H5]
MGNLPYERRHFAEGLGNEWGRGYASVLCNMAGLERREGSLSSARQKTARTQRVGIMYALVWILAAEHGLTEEAAKEKIKADVSEWNKAAEVDEAAEREAY